MESRSVFLAIFSCPSSFLFQVLESTIYKFLTMSFPLRAKGYPGFQSSDRVARINCRVVGIKVAIPTKEELKRIQNHETRQSMRIPDTATDTGIDSSVECVLKRM